MCVCVSVVWWCGMSGVCGWYCLSPPSPPLSIHHNFSSAGLTCQGYIQSILRPLFSRSSFERDLSIDLRNEDEDQTVNQREFLKIIKIVFENLFSTDVL